MAANRVLAACMLLVGCASAGGQNHPRSAAEAEMAFARDAQTRTVNEAFLTAFTSDGILFRPTAVNVHEALRARPMNAALELIWAPSSAETSAAGDMAVTTGPSQWGTRGAPLTGSGYFLSVWRSNGKQWQVAIDAGIEAPITAPVDMTARSLSLRTLRPSPTRSDDLEQMRNDLLHMDGQLNADYPALLRQHAVSDLHVYRNGTPPTATIGDALNVAKGDEEVSFSSQAAFVSRSGDLGYTYGTAVKGSESGAYLRVWRNQDGNWKVAYDLK